MPKNESRNVTYVDPLFNSPPNVKDMEHGVVDRSSEGIIGTGGLAAPNFLGGTNGGVAWPISMVVLSQDMKTNPDGTHTVDVVVQIGDVPGAINYNVRLSI